MRHFTGMLAAAGLVLGMVGESKAQMGTPAGFSYGNPNFSSYGATGSGFSGLSAGSGLGYSGLGYSGLGYSGLSAGSMGYSRGYGGLTASSYLAGPGAPTWGGTGYGYRPGYAGPSPYYSAYNGAYPSPAYQRYSYPTYGYGSRGGFRPFRKFR